MRGDKDVYDDQQVVEAATEALASDFKKEVQWPLVMLIKSIFLSHDNSLLAPDPEVAIQELEAAKRLAASSVFGMNAIAWSIVLINEGRFGSAAFYDAIGLAAKERGGANVLQIEEHYVRKTDKSRASRVGKRIKDAIAGLSESRLGARLVAPRALDVRPSRSRKKTHLDEGVPL
jgi:hypothetical protein